MYITEEQQGDIDTAFLVLESAKDELERVRSVWKETRATIRKERGKNTSRSEQLAKQALGLAVEDDAEQTFAKVSTLVETERGLHAVLEAQEQQVLVARGDFRKVVFDIVRQEFEDCLLTYERHTENLEAAWLRIGGIRQWMGAKGGAVDLPKGFITDMCIPAIEGHKARVNGRQRQKLEFDTGNLLTEAQNHAFNQTDTTRRVDIFAAEDAAIAARRAANAGG